MKPGARTILSPLFIERPSAFERIRVQGDHGVDGRSGIVVGLNACLEKRDHLLRGHTPIVGGVEIRDRRIGDPDLGAIDDPVITIPPQPGMTEAPTSIATPPVTLPPAPTMGQHEAEKAPPKIQIDGVNDPGQLSDVVGTTIPSQKKALKLQDPSVKTDVASQQADVLGLPDYIRKSKPWRWAHELGKTGNPYKPDTKSWHVFNLYHQHERTVPQCVAGVAEIPRVAEKLSYLLTVYEVTSQCLIAGLLVMDSETGIVGVCKAAPQPRSAQGLTG